VRQVAFWEIGQIAVQQRRDCACAPADDQVSGSPPAKRTPNEVEIHIVLDVSRFAGILRPVQPTGFQNQ
jgi:hypothetical protein